MMIDGRAIAADIYRQLRKRRDAKSLALGIVVVGANSVVESFVGIKTREAKRLGVEVRRVDLPEHATTQQTIQAVEGLVEETDAVIVQLPLPRQIDTDSVLAVVPPEKDVDAINPTVPELERPVHAPVALAVLEILRRAGVEPRGKRAVVVGAGRLVGAPSAWLLKTLGAEVSMFTLDQGSIEDLKTADIAVLGAGNPGFIKPEHLKKGVAIIDAGASEQKGKVRGDADLACAEVASVFTPVPGGVGPVAVAMIFRNLLDLVGA